MNEETEFTKIIAEAKRAASEHEAAEQASAMLQQSTRERELAIAEESLTGIVAPLLEKARMSLHHAETLAEIGNGRDRFECLRLSLRIAKGREALVFTACNDLTSYLGWHTEPVDLRCEKRPTPILNPNSAEITRIIGEFISQSIKPRP